MSPIIDFSLILNNISNFDCIITKRCKYIWMQDWWKNISAIHFAKGNVGQWDWGKRSVHALGQSIKQNLKWMVQVGVAYHIAHKEHAFFNQSRLDSLQTSWDTSWKYTSWFVMERGQMVELWVCSYFFAAEFVMMNSVICLTPSKII